MSANHEWVEAFPTRLSIYEIKHLIDKMGGLDTARKAIGQFRNAVKAAGFPDLHLNAIAGNVNGLGNLPELLPSLGIRSVTSYTWVHQLHMPVFPATDYASFLDPAEDYWRKAPKHFGVPYHPEVPWAGMQVRELFSPTVGKRVATGFSQS